MKLWKKLFPKDLTVSLFNAGWWLHVILTVLGLFLFTLYGNHLPIEERLHYIFVTSVIEYIILRLYKFYLIRVRDDYPYFDNLPCFLCNQSTILCIIASLTNNTHLMSFCICVGSFGSILAFLFPDKIIQNQPFFGVQTLGFYGYHGLLIITCLSFYTLGLYRPVLTDGIWNTLLLFVHGVITHIVNVTLIKTGLDPIANYSFTIRPDNAFLEKLYHICPRQFFYILPVLLISAAISFVILLLLP
ncbi:MAG: YwaF family protein [Erysipelotrichaceae bacterium]|nr:YwaF family protein [Erysipelotrichaceae bacterium]